ncbi:GerAB/ArcD/ProY family transporter [Paenibacillus physcomitrellae]|uniref:Uncharacterized protein n=1 Tax=Paenibacillus physcomitrellae TaxID=1619311 RepID=A0ABQ1FNU0_9BACL|nr:GerAB/ArcD/ProY family transporter [Paenibacillus physcomitrellae]GGA24299.1 hypothetical protein GCM10010917_06420 [Paenibacillus physcomitrellae]
MDKSFPVVVMYILTHLALIFFMYPTYIVSATSSGHWLPVLFGYLIHLIVLVAYLTGLGYFNNQDIVEILTSNKIAAILLLLPVIIYLILLAIVTTRAISEIITIVYLSKTPTWVIMCLFLVIAGYMANSGLKALLRIGILLGLIFIPIILMVLIGSFQNIDWRYIFPLVSKEMWSFSFLSSESFHKSGFAFTGAFVFFGFIPKQFSLKRKHILLSSLFLFPIFLAAVYVPVLTFGEATAAQFQYPFITSLDTVESNWMIFDRITVFFLQSLIAFVMLYIGLVMWEAVTILKRTVIKVKHGYILIALVLFVFAVCLQITDWADVEKIFYWNTLLRSYIIIVLPATLLLLGIYRKRKYAQQKG